MKPVTHSENEPIVVSRITELLIQQGKGQQELTDHLGLHRNNFTEWKRGGKRSYMYYIDEIARFLEVSPTFLLRGVDDDAGEYSEIINRYSLMSIEQRKRLINQADVILHEL